MQMMCQVNTLNAAPCWITKGHSKWLNKLEHGQKKAHICEENIHNHAVLMTPDCWLDSNRMGRACIALVGRLYTYLFSSSVGWLSGLFGLPYLALLECRDHDGSYKYHWALGLQIWFACASSSDIIAVYASQQSNHIQILTVKGAWAA